jgi:hypothetical protein
LYRRGVGLGSASVRVLIAVLALILFMGAYSYLLYSALVFSGNSFDELMEFSIRTSSIKVILFSIYMITNCIMSRGYQTRFENEILLTGLFSVIFISVSTLLHYTHLLIMPTQWNLLLFNGTTIAFFLIIYIEGRKHDLFKD